MTKVIIIQGNDLESYYQRTMDILHAKYHTYPSTDNETIIPPVEESLNGHYENLAGNRSDNLEYDGSVPLGKLVI